MTTAKYSFFHADDGTAMGEFDQMEIPVCPQVGQLISISSDFTSPGAPAASDAFEITRVHHTLILDPQMKGRQQIDIFLKATGQGVYDYFPNLQRKG